VHLGSFQVWRVPIGNYKVHDEDTTLLSTFSSIAPRTNTFKREKQQPTKMKGKPFVSWNFFDLCDGIDDDDVMIIPGSISHASPLHTSVATLSNPSTLDDPSQVLSTSTPSQLPLLSFTICLIHASTCSLNPLLVDVLKSSEPSLACSPSLAFFGGLNFSSNSVIHCLKEMTKASWCRSEIWNIDFDNIKKFQVPLLLRESNGNKGFGSILPFLLAKMHKYEHEIPVPIWD
jgi:hypothetical protein